jgi:hypothetical protein
MFCPVNSFIVTRNWQLFLLSKNFIVCKFVQTYNKKILKLKGFLFVLSNEVLNSFSPCSLSPLQITNELSPMSKLFTNARGFVRRKPFQPSLMLASKTTACLSEVAIMWSTLW